MLALIFAMITLSPDPDPLATPTAVLHDRLIPPSGFASDPAGAASGLTGGIVVAPVCTFGAPRFGTGLWNATEDLSRTFAQPACSSFGTSASGLPLPLDFVQSPVFSNGFVRLETAGSRPAGTAVFHPSLPARFTAPLPVSRVEAGYGAAPRQGQPAAFRPRPVSGAAQRAH